MLEFLTKLWRWIKGLFVRRAARPGQDVHRPVAARPALSDVEYENYFMQLLETLEQGLGRGELRGWLITRRVREEELANWLGRQRERWMAQPEQHGELARRLERLGRVASGELGVVAGAIGATVLEQQITDNDSGQIEDRETSSLEELPESRSSGVGEEGKTDDVDSRLDEVIQQHRAGNLSEALKLSKRIIEDYPEDFRGWSLDGFLLSNLGREKEALASYEEAIKYKPDYYIYWYVRGNTLSNLGREEEALASYGEAIKHKPDYHIAWSNRGNALSDLGRYEQAIASHEEAIKHKPDCHEAWSNRGNALSDLGRYEEAIASHEEAIKHKPDYHIAWTNRGVVLSNLERYEEAIASHEEAIKHKPDCHEAWSNRGYALSNLERYEEALASYEEAIKHEPEDYLAWYGRGNTLWYLRRYEEALASHEEAIKHELEGYLAWYGRGKALSDLGLHEKALASYEEAIKHKPDLHEAWSDRGIALSALNRYEDAITSYEETIKYKPDCSLAWNNRGRALFAISRYEEALASFEEAIKHEPNKYLTWFNRGNALSATGKYEEAIASYEEAIKYEPDEHRIWGNRSNVAYNSRKQHKHSYHLQLADTLHFNLSSTTSALSASFHKSDDRAWTLERLQRSLEISAQILQETFPADTYPEIAQAIDQSSLQQLLDAVQQPFSQQFFDSIRQPLSDEAYNQIKQGALLHPSMSREELRQRGYPGKVASLTAELGRAIQPQTHPEGWGYLHHKLGLTHCKEAKQPNRPRYSLWRFAEEAYKEALQTLQPPQFTEQRLEVLQDLITVLLDLQETAEAQQLQREGTDLLNRTLSESASPARQRRLALKFASFTQLTVDLALKDGNPTDALTLAETSKNTCLRWMLSDAYEDIPQVSYEQMQSLLAPNRAALYWHLSPNALTGFLLLPNSPQPLPIPAPDLLRSTAEDDTDTDEADQSHDRFQQLLTWENWLETWNQQYQSYIDNAGKTIHPDKSAHPWRETLPEQLDQLKAILDIDFIEQQLQGQGIEQLILVPHRDLHRLPLHYCFDGYTCTYLPSIHLGLSRPAAASYQQMLVVENPKSTFSIRGKNKKLDDLPFAEIEAELVRQSMLQHLTTAPTTVKAREAQREKVIAKLEEAHQIFHFTGHGVYDAADPAASCLFLSGPDTLDLNDIIELDLSHCPLVCLAACETAVTGNQTITDEYVGLVSAFLKAGVSHVVSTLWRVESAASAMLVVKFYEQLQADQPPEIALREAQTFLRQATRQQVIAQTKAMLAKLPPALAPTLRTRLKALRESKIEYPYAHPYFWAAFSISGL